MNQLLFPVIVSLFPDLHIKEETGPERFPGTFMKVDKRC